MPKLSTVTTAAADAAQTDVAVVDIGGIDVTVTFSVGRMTGALLQDVYDTRQPREIAACLESVVVGWDLTDDDDRPLEPGVDTLLRLPFSALMALLNGIQTAARPDPKAEGSFAAS